jgi:hypothetical protein
MYIPEDVSKGIDWEPKSKLGTAPILPTLASQPVAATSYPFPRVDPACDFVALLDEPDASFEPAFES